MALEDILRQNIGQAFEFAANAASLTSLQKRKLRTAQIEYAVDENLDGYARFEIWKKGNEERYTLRFKPEAVNDFAAIGEEAFHAARLIIDDEVRNRLFKAPQNSKEYENLVALEEYAARYTTLAYLNNLKIKEYNNLWSRIADSRVTLYTTKPSDTLSHFYGYAQAEADFKKFGTRGVRKAFFAREVSVLRDAYKLETPQIVRISA